MIKFICWIGLLSCLVPNVITASEPLVLEKMGVMFVGGREATMAGGGRFGGGGSQTQIVDQAPVHFLVPPEEKRRGKLPVVMVPGMGLTSYLYLGTPDGRDGWAQIFARAGHPVYVFDEPGNAISGFEVAKITAAETPPRVMLWSNEITWRRWGIGPEPGVPAEDSRFPFEHIDQLHASMTAVMGGGGGGRGGARGGGGSGRGGLGRGGGSAGQGFGGRGRRFGRGQSTPPDRPADEQASEDNAQDGEDEAEPQGSGRVGRGPRGGGQSNAKVDAMVALLEKTGPAILIVHSAAGPTGFQTARTRGDLVRGIVAVEVTGSPTDADDIRTHFDDKRFLGVYGDHFDLRPMQGRYEASVTMAKLITEAGGRGAAASRTRYSRQLAPANARQQQRPDRRHDSSAPRRLT